ncbi:hypothetical protein Landi51_13018 [Colletotrichum acutatum]
MLINNHDASQRTSRDRGRSAANSAEGEGGDHDTTREDENRPWVKAIASRGLGATDGAKEENNDDDNTREGDWHSAGGRDREQKGGADTKGEGHAGSAHNQRRPQVTDRGIQACTSCNFRIKASVMWLWKLTHPTDDYLSVSYSVSMGF